MRRSTRIANTRGVTPRLKSAPSNEKSTTPLATEPTSISVNEPPHKRQKTRVKCEEISHACDSVFSLQQMPLDLLFEVSDTIVSWLRAMVRETFRTYPCFLADLQPA